LAATPRRTLTRALAAVTVLIAVGEFAGACAFEPNTDSLGAPKPDYRQAAAHLRAVTRPDERVFVWGWFPALYLASDRCPSTRFVYAHHLAGRAPSDAGKRAHSVPEGWQMLMADLEREPPPYLLDVSHGEYDFQYAPLERYPLLADFVARRYAFDREIAGVRFYRRLAR
jgi:hypothetical protein